VDVGGRQQNRAALLNSQFDELRAISCDTLTSLSNVTARGQHAGVALSFGRFMKPHVSARHHAGALCPASRGKVPARSITRSHHSSTDKLVSWFLQLSLLAVWKSLTSLSVPVARVLAVYVWTGKSVLRVCSWATRLVLKLTGWLASPAFPHSRWLRQWSKHLPWQLDVRKWHVVVGECRFAAFLRQPEVCASSSAKAQP
jgi:hypothetical protein